MIRVWGSGFEVRGLRIWVWIYKFVEFWVHGSGSSPAKCLVLIFEFHLSYTFATRTYRQSAAKQSGNKSKIENGFHAKREQLKGLK